MQHNRSYPPIEKSISAVTNLDERYFPYEFECTDCPDDSVANITHEEAVEAVPPEVEATPRQAVDSALTARGWWRKRTGNLLCPSCMDRLE